MGQTEKVEKAEKELERYVEAENNGTLCKQRHIFIRHPDKSYTENDGWNTH